MTTRKLTSVFSPPSALKAAPVLNYEGAPAFVRSDDEALIRVLTTGTFEPTFYAGARDLAKEAAAIFQKWAQTDPYFLAQAIVYARNEGYMRLAPVTALVYLSQAENKGPFRKAFRKTINTPGDLQDFLTLIRKSQLRGMGRAVKTACSEYLEDLSEFHTIKYGSEAQDMSLRDIFRFVRPRLPEKSVASGIAHYLTKGEWAEEITPQIAAYERFLKAESLAEKIELINAGRLPHEVVTAHIPDDPQAWAAAMRQMPIFALVRNLVTLYRHKVFESDENMRYARAVLSDPQRIQRSKMFPFRFLAAYRQAQANNLPLQIQMALQEAVELAVVNVPTIHGRVLIANDVSGSMSSRVSEKSDLTCAEVAGTLAAALYKSTSGGQGARIVSFDQDAHPRDNLGGRGLLEIAQAVSETGGGTYLGAPLEWAFAHNERFDVGVFVTDSVDWVGWLVRPSSSSLLSQGGRAVIYPHGTIDLLRAYKKRCNPNFRAFFLQVMPYEQAVVPPDERDAYYLYGWGDETLRYIGQQANGESQVARVRAIEL